MDRPTGDAAPEGDRRRKNLEQWRHARIDRFIRRQWQVRDWINFADVADFCAREAGSIAPDEGKRTRAYEELADAIIKGEFDKDGRSRVFFLHPSSTKVRMTWGIARGRDPVQFGRRPWPRTSCPLLGAAHDDGALLREAPVAYVASFVRASARCPGAGNAAE